MPKKSPAKSKYENNPFFIAGNGITMLFNSATGVAVLLLVISIINAFSGRSDGSDGDPQRIWNNFTEAVSPWSAGDWAIAIASVGIIGLALIMISALISGISAYTSFKLSQGERVKLSEAFRTAFDNLWSFLWLQIVIAVKTFLWLLLFIVPGIIMAFRYSLASTAFFDERKKLRGNAAVKESLRLTKGAWITTFSSNFLFNMLSLGVLSHVVTTGVNAVLYRQFDELGNKKKPEAHWLSWVTLTIPVILFALALIFVIAIITGMAIGGSVTTR